MRAYLLQKRAFRWLLLIPLFSIPQLWAASAPYIHSYDRSWVQYHYQQAPLHLGKENESYFLSYKKINPPGKKHLDSEEFTRAAVDDRVLAQIVLPIQVPKKLFPLPLKLFLGHRAYLSLIASSMKFPLQYFQGVYGLATHYTLGTFQIGHQFSYLDNYYGDGNALYYVLRPVKLSDSWLFQTQLAKLAAPFYWGIHLNLASGEDNLELLKGWIYLTLDTQSQNSPLNEWVLNGKMSLGGGGREDLELFYSLYGKLSYFTRLTNERLQELAFELFIEQLPELRKLTLFSEQTRRYGFRVLLEF